METNELDETEEFIDDDPVATCRSLVYLYFLRHPQMTARKIYIIWDRSKIFREYERPEETLLVTWIAEFHQVLKPNI